MREAARSSLSDLKRRAAQQFEAARDDLSRPGRTQAINEYYATLERLQALLRARARQRKE